MGRPKKPGSTNISSKGYVLVRDFDHPRRNCNNKIHEHILVLEKAFGRPILATEAPHHIDGNPQNNNIGNLMLFETHGMHAAYHARLRAYEACGHYEWRQCGYCHQWDAPENLCSGIRSVFHKECKKKDRRKRYLEKGI